jgi:hypothetical protein
MKIRQVGMIIISPSKTKRKHEVKKWQWNHYNTSKFTLTRLMIVSQSCDTTTTTTIPADFVFVQMILAQSWNNHDFNCTALSAHYIQINICLTGIFYVIFQYIFIFPTHKFYQNNTWYIYIYILFFNLLGISSKNWNYRTEISKNHPNLTPS